MGNRGAMIRLFGERHPAVALAVLALLVPILLGAAGVAGVAQAGAEGSGVICTSHGAGEFAADRSDDTAPPAAHMCCGPVCPQVVASALPAGAANLGFTLARGLAAPPPNANAARHGRTRSDDPIRGPPLDIA